MLIMACLLVAVAVAVTVIDIKIKNDLLALAQRVEDRMGAGNENIRRQKDRTSGDAAMGSSVLRRPMVDNHSGLEKENGFRSPASAEESHWETVSLFGDQNPPVSGGH